MVYTITDAGAIHYAYENNAREIWDVLRNAGLTEESAAGIIGNIEAESFCNPGQGEIGKNMSDNYGLGLIQWTPGSQLKDWFGSTGWYNGYYQMTKVVDGSGFGASHVFPQYSYSWSQFKQLQNVEEATKAYLWERERPNTQYGLDSQPNRIKYANYYYAKFTGRTPEPTPDPPPEPVEDNTILAVLINMFKPKDYIHEKSTIQKLLERGLLK